MKAITLSVLLLTAGSSIGQELSRELNCRALVAEVRPSGDEGEKGKQYLADAEKAFRDCQSSRLPLEVRVNALRKYAIASANLGREQEGIARLHDALGLLDRAASTDPIILIDLLDELSTLESIAKLRIDATSHAKRALELRQKTYGRVSAEAVRGMVKLAMTYADADEMSKTEPLIRDAVRIAEKVCGPECDALVDAYTAMQTLYEMQGNQEEAQRYAEMAQDAVPTKRKD